MYVNELCALISPPQHKHLLEVASLVSASKLPNYKGLKIPIPSNLNIPVWREKLCDYDDKGIVDFLEYGFPAGYTCDLFPSTDIKNHPTALQYHKDVSNYLTTELDLQAMIGPFPTASFHMCATSPLHTVEKKHSSKRRIVLDLSYPAGASVLKLWHTSRHI